MEFSIASSIFVFQFLKFGSLFNQLILFFAFFSFCFVLSFILKNQQIVGFGLDLFMRILLSKLKVLRGFYFQPKSFSCFQFFVGSVSNLEVFCALVFYSLWVLSSVQKFFVYSFFVQTLSLAYVYHDLIQDLNFEGKYLKKSMIYDSLLVLLFVECVGVYLFTIHYYKIKK